MADPTPRVPTCDILVRSYWRDFDWLAYCLASIAKHCDGFRSVVVVVPGSSWSRLHRLDLSDPRIRCERCPDYRDDYLGQQVTKLLADRVSDADLVCHVDSDCVFTRRVTPEALLDGDRVRMLMRPISTLGRHRPWSAPTRRFLGEDIEYDFMVRPPFTYPRWLYREARAHARALHGIELADYVLGRPPRGFSEFNALGALARARNRSRFSWVDVSTSDPGQPVCNWYWSWGRLEPELRSEIERLLSA